MSKSYADKVKSMRKRIMEFASVYRCGGYSEDQLNKFRTLLVNKGNDPTLVDMFIITIRGAWM